MGGWVGGLGWVGLGGWVGGFTYLGGGRGDRDAQGVGEGTGQERGGVAEEDSFGSFEEVRTFGFGEEAGEAPEHGSAVV